MKKILCVLLFLHFYSLVALGNSGPPMAILREIMVDSTGEWTVELYLYQAQAIDSIQVGFSSGKSMVHTYALIPPNDLVLLQNSNLESPITANSAGDYITIRSWGSGYWHYDSLAFGNYPGSYLDCAHYGASYANADFPNYPIFAIDNSPTMGFENDTTDAVAYFSGTAYDVNGNVFTSGIIWLLMDAISISINPDGSFYGILPARRYQTDKIRIAHYGPYSFVDYNIVPINFCAPPGTHIHQDIIATGYVNIDEPPISSNPVVVVSPNPFSSSVQFYWKASDFNPGDKVKLTISDLQGKQLLIEDMQTDKQNFTWYPQESLAPGIYLYRLFKNGISVASGKIVRI